MINTRLQNAAATTLLLMAECALIAALFYLLTDVVALSPVHRLRHLSASQSAADSTRQLLLLWLCYLVSFLSTAHRTADRLAKAHQVFGYALHTWAGFLLLSLAMLWCQHMPLFTASFLLPFYVLMLALLPALRLAFFYLVRYLRRRGHNHVQALLVGNGYSLSQLFVALSKPSAGIDIIGYFDDYPDSNRPGNLLYLGRPAQVADYLQQNVLPHQLICSLPANRDEEVSHILRACDEHHVRFTAVPLIYRALSSRGCLQSASPTLTLSAKPEPLSLAANRCLKRAFDLLCSALLLLTLFPLIFFVVAVISKLRYRGPVLFCTRRTDSRGRSYQHFSFGISKSSSIARRIGIDRWPELINVLTGHLSIVGVAPQPSAETPAHDTPAAPECMPKYGLFNWKEQLAQILQEECHDDWYRQNWAFTTDLFVILRKLTHPCAANTPHLQG